MMALMRIAFAAAALFYIAPHLGGDMLRSARSLVSGAGPESGTTDAIAGAALAYCQKNPETCLKIARAALPIEPAGDAALARMSLRPALQDHALQDHAMAEDRVPLPPARPPELRPAMK